MADTLGTVIELGVVGVGCYVVYQVVKGKKTAMAAGKSGGGGIGLGGGPGSGGAGGFKLPGLSNLGNLLNLQSTGNALSDFLDTTYANEAGSLASSIPFDTNLTDLNSIVAPGHNPIVSGAGGGSSDAGSWIQDSGYYYDPAGGSIAGGFGGYQTDYSSSPSDSGTVDSYLQDSGYY